MTFSELRKLLYADAHRYRHIPGGMFYRLLVDPYVSLVFWFRVHSFLESKGGVLRAAAKLIEILSAWFSRVRDVHLPVGTEIGGGFVLVHAIGSVINRTAKIGENVTILQGVTIGSKRPNNNGVPTIGNNVVICAGAILIGNIHIGDNCLISAGSVVMHDVPAGSVVAGNPAKVISDKGRQLVEEYKVIG